LLVLAQSWLWANERYCVWTLRAWPRLQTDIVTAIEWLCYLSGNSFTYYLDLWTYPNRQQREWAELHKILVIIAAECEKIEQQNFEGMQRMT